MLVDFLPQGLKDLLGPDLTFWIGYLTNGRHLIWYASVQYTIEAMVFGAAVALLLGLIAAAIRNSAPPPFNWLAAFYTNIVRGVPDVLFFLFFPIAFEQGLEWVLSKQVCSVADLAANAGHWPPCPAANLSIDTVGYLILASISLGIVYGAFVANVIAGALQAVPKGQIEAARAYGMSRFQVIWKIQIRQMWIYAMPGLSNVWMSLVKATSLLSLLQILDFVTWAKRLGAGNYSTAAGLVHEDWRWRYYLVLLIFYILVTFISEKIFAVINRHVRRGMPLADQNLA